ncbi:MAG: hypothetical protein AABX12_05170 [Nanoarchaeota archaeon]
MKNLIQQLDELANHIANDAQFNFTERKRVSFFLGSIAYTLATRIHPALKDNPNADILDVSARFTIKTISPHLEDIARISSKYDGSTVDVLGIFDNNYSERLDVPSQDTLDSIKTRFYQLLEQSKKLPSPSWISEMVKEELNEGGRRDSDHYLKHAGGTKGYS